MQCFLFYRYKPKGYSSHGNTITFISGSDQTLKSRYWKEVKTRIDDVLRNMKSSLNADDFKRWMIQFS